MRSTVAATLLLASLVFADGVTDQNINSRYKVESIELAKPIDKRIPRSMREEVESMVGRNFDPGAVTDVANRLRKQLKLVVRYRVERGLQPEHVKVVYDAHERRWDEDDAKVTKLTYHQKQGWTAGLEVGFDAGPNRFEVGWQSDADRLLERYQGWNAGWGLRLHDRVRFRFDFEALRQTWNPATELASFSQPQIPGLYRQRVAAEPALAVELAPGLSLTAGVAIQHLDPQISLAPDQAANAAAATLRYRVGERPSGSAFGHAFETAYTLRSATGALASDFIYTRHAVDATYRLDQGPHHVTIRGAAGVIGGEAPLFERFALGDTHTLRGWNKFDIDPLGGSRMAHASAGYRYRVIGIFYDTGAVWDRDETADTRHSVGVTVATRSGPYLTVAFPLRSGMYAPIFMMGMNF